MDFEPYFKVHNLVNVHHKSIELVQITNLNMIFYVMGSDYRLVKIWNSPQFPAVWIKISEVLSLTENVLCSVEIKLKVIEYNLYF